MASGDQGGERGIMASKLPSTRADANAIAASYFAEWDINGILVRSCYMQTWLFGGVGRHSSKKGTDDALLSFASSAPPDKNNSAYEGRPVPCTPDLGLYDKGQKAVCTLI